MRKIILTLLVICILPTAIFAGFHFGLINAAKKKVDQVDEKVAVKKAEISISQNNNPPSLSWALVGPFAPVTGSTTTIYTYQVEYTSDNPPQMGYPKVYIGGSYFSMTKVSGDYKTGAIYSYSTTLQPGDYKSSLFFAYDSGGNYFYSDYFDGPYISGWEILTVPNPAAGFYTSIGLDSGFRQHPHISYAGGYYAGDTLGYVVEDSGEWYGEICAECGGDIVDSGDVFQGPSLVVDSNFYPHIAYTDSWSLKYAQWTGTSWSTTTIESYIYSFGSGTSMALGVSNYPQVAYVTMVGFTQYPPEYLKYAKWTGSSWSIQTIDTNIGDMEWTYGSVANTAIALDTNMYPHIAYTSMAGLKYASWNGATWAIQTVDSISVGPYVSMLLDSNNYPHISYYDATNKHLKYAVWTGSAWIVQTVDSSGDVGKYPAMALDSSGNPHISYYDATNKNLKYAAWIGSAWAIQAVDSSGGVGGGTSIALDSSGNPNISYSMQNFNIKYAKWVP